MARILFGWELGANRGHIERLLPIARRLLDKGHSVAFALQQLDTVGTDHDERISLWQAPVWTRLLVSNLQDKSRRVATMGDILAQLGLDRPGCLAAMVRGWDNIFAAVVPDLVIADYAPAMLVAAQGRIASISVGDSFAMPPPHLASFPNLIGQPNAYDEMMLLDTVDADLRSIGRQPLAALPAMFTADHYMIGNFAELDAYRDWRPGGHCAPSVKQPFADPVGGQGEEIFVYAYNRIGAESPIWPGLAARRRKVRVHMRDPQPDHFAMFRRLGIIHEPKPLSFPQIARRSRCTVSYGGNGFTSASLIAGLPQLMLPFDLEKLLTANAVDTLGLGRMLIFHKITADEVDEAIGQLLGDANLAARLLSLAPDFRQRMAVTMADEVISCIEQHYN